MNKIIVLKFGGSSLADNEKLELVAKRIIKIYDKNKKVVVVLSAQGKTTDKLIQETNNLVPQKYPRELATLLSTGEQISISKLSMLLNYMGYPSISLTGWQAGIYTEDKTENSNIKYIDTKKIKQELEKGKIVIIAGFQGINKNGDITTLGRGGSDTTAVALAAALKTKKCYIFSDVDGVYTADPNKVKSAKRLKNISYKEMSELSNEGAKVLHNRCVKIAEKFSIPIVTQSTFSSLTNNEIGTKISKEIEDNNIKSIVKKEVSRISIIGNKIINNYEIIEKILKFIHENNIELLNIEIDETKMTLTSKNELGEDLLNVLHQVIFEDSSK